MQFSTKQILVRCAYSWLWRFLTPFYVFKLLWRGRKEVAYREHIGERFGFYRAAPAHAGQYVWIHAVSLGETRAAAVLVDALREQIPGVKLLLTHGTATGRVQGEVLLHAQDAQSWLPIDTPGSVKRFMRHFRPRIGLLMETEMWPNVMHEATLQGIPMVLVNARLSERSLRGIRKVGALLQPAYQALTAALAQSQDDAMRLKQAGVSQVQVLGNLKYDMQPDPALLASGQRCKNSCARPVIMAASTREGEEDLLLEAWKNAFCLKASGGQGAAQSPILLLVPRHPQRFEQVAQKVKEAGLSLSQRSTWSETSLAEGVLNASVQNADVWLGDSLSEMPLYYGLSEMVLLGGSFKCYGGQNLLEALACACPVIMGEHTYNFQLACSLALQAGVAYRVADMAEALRQAKIWLHEPEGLHELQMRSQAFIESHQGAGVKMAVYIKNITALSG